ncbi:MAG: TIM barrel protein, partial [Roseiflexaceae bacterium]|nr:TIM barrel protein [Roseiflexaceae bacterium]
MHRAASSFCRIDLPLQQALPLLHGEAPATIELFCEAPHLDTTADWRGQVAWLRQYAQSHGLTYALHAPCFDLNPASANAGVRTEVARQYQIALAIAEALGARHMVIHSGPRSDPRLSAAEGRQHVRAMLELLVPHAEAHGVRLALE